MTDAPGSDCTDGHHRDGQAEAERGDERKAERELFHLETDEEHGEGGGARQQPAGEPEEDDLRRGHFAVHETLLNVQRVGRFVGILKLRALREIAVVVIVRMAVVVLLELRGIGVRVTVVGKRERQVKLMRFGDVRGRFEKALFGDKRECLPRPASPHRLDDDAGRLRHERFAVLGKGQSEDGWHASFKHGQMHYAMAGVDQFRVIMAALVMLMRGCRLRVPPRPPEHPERQAGDEHG